MYKQNSRDIFSIGNKFSCRKMLTITVTIDVEPDASPGSWKTSNPITFQGVKIGIPAIENAVKDIGVPVTYFLQPVVLYDDNCVKCLREIQGEMGSHLHGEYIGPEAKFPGPDFSGCDPGEKQSDYSNKLEMSKMSSLTDLFVEKMGYYPSSFRAGRFGISSNTIKCLASLQYTHDSSVVPGHKNSRGIKNRVPYKFRGITEVPITVTRGKKWLRPTPGYSNLNTMKQILTIFKKTKSNVCCMFHNVEVVPGISPYCDSQSDCDDMLGVLSDMLKFALSIGYHPIVLKEVKV